MKVLVLMLMALPLFAQVTPKTQVCNSSGSVCGAVTATGVTVQGAGTAGAAAGGVVTVQGSASGTAVPVSVSSVPSNQSVNVAQVGGTATDTNSGNKSAGTQRIVIATDQPSMTNPQPANITQVQGAAPDPCFGTARSYFSISQTASAQIITGTSSKKIYICSLNVGPNADAENVALVEGTGTVCATNTIAVLGTPAATAANGWQIAANGGLATNGGGGSMAATSVNADNVCLLQSGSGRVAGGGSYVVQ